jgi:hypothetical protein
MSPEDIRRAQQMAASMPPEQMASHASSFAAGMGGAPAPQASSQYDTCMRLKNEGNALHGQKRFREAAEKYEQALASVQGESAWAAAGCLELLCWCWTDCYGQGWARLVRQLGMGCACFALAMPLPDAGCLRGCAPERGREKGCMAVLCLNIRVDRDCHPGQLSCLHNVLKSSPAGSALQFQPLNSCYILVGI